MRDKHLTEKDYFNIYYRLDDYQAVAEHLSSCDRCTKEYEAFAYGSDLASKDILTGTIDNIGDCFFLREANAIISVISDREGGRKKRSWRSPLMLSAAVTAIVLLLTLFLSTDSTIDTGETAQVEYIMTQQDIDDDILLMEIEEMDDTGGIEGLEIFVDLLDENGGSGLNEHGALKTSKTVKA